MYVYIQMCKNMSTVPVGVGMCVCVGGGGGQDLSTWVCAQAQQRMYCTCVHTTCGRKLYIMYVSMCTYVCTYVRYVCIYVRIHVQPLLGCEFLYSISVK